MDSITVRQVVPTLMFQQSHEDALESGRRNCTAGQQGILK